MVATTKEQNLPKNSSGPDKGYPNLFSPAKIGRMRLKNKIIRAVNTTLYASPKDGTVTQLLLDHYAVEAAGWVWSSRSLFGKFKITIWRTKY